MMEECASRLKIPRIEELLNASCGRKTSSRNFGLHIVRATSCSTASVRSVTRLPNQLQPYAQECFVLSNAAPKYKSSRHRDWKQAWALLVETYFSLRARRLLRSVQTTNYIEGWKCDISNPNQTLVFTTYRHITVQFCTVQWSGIRMDQ